MILPPPISVILNFVPAGIRTSASPGCAEYLLMSTPFLTPTSVTLKLAAAVLSLLAQVLMYPWSTNCLPCTSTSSDPGPLSDLGHLFIARYTGVAPVAS